MIVKDLEQVPEEWRDKFEKTVIDGEEVYQDKDHGKLARAYYSEKESKQKTAAALQDYQDKEAERIAEAEKRALEKARKEGNSEEVQRLLNEQMKDRLDRAKDEARREVEKEYNLKLANKQAESELATIVSKMNPIDERAAKNLRILLSTRQKVDENGNIIYLNDDGQASSLNAESFYSDALKSGDFDYLIKPEHVVSGGGKLNGSKGGQATSEQNPFKKGEHFNLTKQAEIIKTDPVLAAKLKAEV